MHVSLKHHQKIPFMLGGVILILSTLLTLLLFLVNKPEYHETSAVSNDDTNTSSEYSEATGSPLFEEREVAIIEPESEEEEGEEEKHSSQPEETKPNILPIKETVSSTPLVWGVYAGYKDSDLLSFEAMVGSEVDIGAIFVNWHDPFPSSFGKQLAAKEKTMLVFWEQYGVTLDDIINGESDAYIRQFATDVRSYEGNVILAPLHEMNGDWYPWSGTAEGNTPMKVVAAWRHIVTTFGEVPNVQFAWAVNSTSVPDTELNAITHYYPGDQYVDYVAVDGFNFGTPWQSFNRVFEDALQELKFYNKPIYILSMASAAGAQKAAWITDAFTVALPKHPEVVGWVWFSEDKERDWRVNSDSASLDAFRAILP